MKKIILVYLWHVCWILIFFALAINTVHAILWLFRDTVSAKTRIVWFSACIPATISGFISYVTMQIIMWKDRRSGKNDI